MAPSGRDIAWRPSPNFGDRRDGLTPSLIVLHHTAMRSAEDAIVRLCDPETEVSAHFLICQSGAITQMVAEDKRAWHAGAGEWRGAADINSRSIGVELDNAGDHPFTEPQMVALEALLRRLMQDWSIRPEGIIGHSDMAPGRKSDPGPHFDWARLARQGLATGHVPTPSVPDVNEESFRRAARGAGFTADVPFDVLLAAVRLRFGPWRTGPLSAADYAFPA